ncbi:MAG: elongation factor Ts [Candidatus Dojkabacteria bacterium]|nr:MAG: elongation factor Ts [Candidatus Dojkabacteria bacterium]
MSIELIKELREKTGAGISAIQEALEESNGDVEKAIIYLRQKGVTKGEKRAGKQANEGIISTYVHHNNRLVVVVEVNTETDFAANSEDLQKFAKDLAVHIAAMNPRAISLEDLDSSLVEKEKAVFEKELEGKPEEVKQKIVEGKMQKFYEENVLLKQSLFSDDSKTVEDYLNEMVAKIGEKIVIRYFYRFELGKPVVFSEAKE